MIPVRVRPMQHSDLDFAAACTAAEGWAGETRQVFEGFYAHDPGGCLIAQEWVATGTGRTSPTPTAAARPIGICVATPYGESGFIGELIVIPEMRDRGVGSQLLAHAVETLHHRGVQNIFLDGVRAAVPLYERAGFRKVCRSLRFSGVIQGTPHPHVRAMCAGDLEAVCDLDRQAFSADRGFFLQRRLSLYPKLCKVLERDGGIAGFIMGRRGPEWASAGPWVVRPDIDRPGDLLESLAMEVGGLGFGVGVLETNADAVGIVRLLGFAERADPPWRMVLGLSGHLGSSNMCYAVGSPAKG